MMADLWAWAQAYPVIASVLAIALWLTSGFFAAMAFALLILPANTLDAAEADDEQASAVSRPAPLPTPWGRSGGNWWGKL